MINPLRPNSDLSQTSHLEKAVRECMRVENMITNRRLISSVGWVPDCRAGGQGFDPWPDQYSGS